MTQFSKPQKFKAILSEKENLNRTVMKITLKLENPKEMEFLSGQFVSLKVSESVYRSYSIFSSMFEKSSISLIIGIAHDGVGANYVRNIQIGDIVEFIGPSGRFVFPENIFQNFIFVATGTGLSPLISMIDDTYRLIPEKNITLLFGIRSPDDLFLYDHLKKLSNMNRNFRYKICFSKETSTKIENSFKGRVTDHMIIDRFSQYFICGNPLMVQDVTKLLIEAGIDETNIFHEKFTVASPIKPKISV